VTIDFDYDSNDPAENAAAVILEVLRRTPDTDRHRTLAAILSKLVVLRVESTTEIRRLVHEAVGKTGEAR
jgi:hypothetical protein